MKIEPSNSDENENKARLPRSLSKAYQESTSDSSEIHENDRYEVTFHYSQMTNALIIHFLHLVFGPLFLPIAYKFFGRTLCCNMQFGLRRYYIKEFLIWLWFIFTMLALWLYYDLNNELLTVYISTGTIILIHLILISVKYGYYPTCIWKQLKKRVFSHKELTQTMLIKSWLVLDEEIAQEEIIMAYKRLNLLNSNGTFEFSHGLCEECDVKIEKFYEKFGLFRTTTDVKILEFSQFIIEELRLSAKKSYFWLTTIMAVMYSASPIALRFYRYGSEWLSMDWLEILYIFYSLLLAFYFSRVFLLFIQSGVEDFKRKKILMAQCTGLISRVDRKFLLIGKNCAPKLNVNDSGTIMSWYYMRRCFLDFGKRYSLRIFLYTSLTLPISVGVIVIIILQMFKVIGVSYNFYFVPFMILISQVIMMVVLMALSAVDLNDYFNIHIDVLLDQIGKVLRKRLITPEKYSDSDKLIDTLDFVISKLEEDKVLRPIKIMGIVMDEIFILKILSIAASGLFAVVQIFYKF